MRARLSLLLSLVVLRASAQLQVIVQPPDPTGWYEACIREAYAQTAQAVAMRASAVSPPSSRLRFLLFTGLSKYVCREICD